MRDFEIILKSAVWESAAHVDRPFVRYPDPEPSPALLWQEKPAHGVFSLSVVIPTSDANRGGYFSKLLNQISHQDFQDFELIVVKGDQRQGRAINIGVALAKGRYILTLDDDSSLPDSSAFSKLVATMNAHPDIGIAGGNNVIPRESSIFIQQAMQQIPRRSWEPVQNITDSDLAEHPCMIMRTEEFKVIGGENELLPRGLDPYLRQAFREFGKRVVVVPDVRYHHLPPNSWGSLIRQYFRNGHQGALVNHHYSQWVIQTPNYHGNFKTQLPVWRRTVRYFRELFESILRAQWIWFVCQLSYAMGFLCGLVALAVEPVICRRHGEES